LHRLTNRGVASARLDRSEADTEEKNMTTHPPDGLPCYRVLTGPDDAAFCVRVSEALSLGYRLHAGPTVTFNGKHVIVAQAVLWPGDGETD